jgi:CheY-like chemotaxis protein
MKAVAPGERDPGAPSVGCGAGDIRGKRILYVDDDPLLRRVASRLPGRAGAICVLAGTHDEAVMLADSEPDLALAILDFQLPGGDVGHLVRPLRAARASLPLIGTSGEDRLAEFAERGVPHFLEKPWHPGDLVRAVSRGSHRFALVIRGAGDREGGGHRDAVCHRVTATLCASGGTPGT